MILDRETSQKFGYVPSEVRPFSKSMLVVKCDRCGKVFDKSAIQLNMCRRNSKSEIDICSDVTCIKWKRTNTMKDRFGVENAGQSAELRAKREETCEKLYGNRHMFMTARSRDKLRKWCGEHGAESNPFQAEYAKQKSCKTCLDRYGTEHASQCDEVRKKIERTLVNRYGSRRNASLLASKKSGVTQQDRYGGVGFASEQIRHKIETTNLMRYGCIRPSDLPMFRDKVVRSYVEKYGCHYFQTSEFKARRKETNIKKYGQENPILKFSRLSRGRISKFQREVYAEILTKYSDAKMEHSVTDNITSDIFIPSINLIVECKGDYWHCNPRKYGPDFFQKNLGLLARDVWKRDAVRESIIEKSHRLIIVWEMDWKKNKSIPTLS